MASAGAALLAKQWSSRSLRDVYADFNDLTLAIVADAAKSPPNAAAPARKRDADGATAAAAPAIATWSGVYG